MVFQLLLPKAVDMAQNMPLWRLLVSSGVMNVVVVVYATNDDDDSTCSKFTQ